MADAASEFVTQATEALRSGNMQQALDLIEQALQLEPSNSEALVLKGICLAQSSQPDAATTAFRDAIAANPNNAKAYYNLATHFFHLQRLAEARAMAEEAVRLEPGHAQANELIRQIQSATVQEAPGVPPMGSPTEVPRGPGASAPPASGYTVGYAGSPRPGYAEPAHSLSMVGKLGSTWNLIIWILAIIWLVSFAGSIMLQWPEMQKAFADAAAGKQVRPEDFQNTGVANILLSLAIMGAWVGAIAWAIMDIMDRRGSWGWIALFVCCCYFAWPLGLPLYMFVGRRKI